MRKLHIIMPMAGEGSRFKDTGINTPKPLIEASGFCFYIRALVSICTYISPDNCKFSFIVRQNHIDEYNINKEILKVIPQANIVAVKQTTRGAVETCLCVKEFIEPDDAILVTDCDLEWRCCDFGYKILDLLNSNNDYVSGMLLSFKSNEPRYSYARTENDVVVETAEKKVISDNALVGAYYFNKGSKFIEIANKLISDNSVDDIKEYYVSLLYNYLIKNDETVLLYTADEINSFGTPEELEMYERNKSVNNRF